MDYEVTQEKVDFYQENGFVQFDNIITEEELCELREALEEIMTENSIASNGPKDGGYYKVLNQKVNVWKDSAAVAKFTLHPRFAEVALKISGSSGIRLFHDHSLWKMPGDSKPTPWHQDTPSMPMTDALSLWLTLDDVDENNGCMMFVPGSQKIGRFTPVDFVNPQHDLFEHAESTGVVKKEPYIVRMKAGSATFHHGLTFHYAHANITDKPRRVLSIIFMPDGTTYVPRNKEGINDHVATRDFPLQTGDLLKGRFFPILAKR